jgi:hypothetical protein
LVEGIVYQGELTVGTVGVGHVGELI